MEKNSLYHYTTLEGFHCMINNNTPNKLRFHATHIRYLNDMSEYVYYQNLLWVSLQKKSKKITKDEFQEFVSSCELFSDPFVVSLTEQGDYLPMWHMYSKNATGVVLEFDKEKLTESLGNFERIGKCHYEETITDESLLNDYTNAIRKMNICDKNIFNVMDLYKLNIKNNMVLHKSPDYIYEKEWRIYSRSQIIHTKVSNGQIKPYVEIELPIDCLKSIKIGPCMPNKEQELQAIKFLLSTKAMADEVKIKDSKITSYRNNM